MKSITRRVLLAFAFIICDPMMLNETNMIGGIKRTFSMAFSMGRWISRGFDPSLRQEIAARATRERLMVMTNELRESGLSIDRQG